MSKESPIASRAKDHADLLAAAVRQLEKHISEPLPPGLYLVATPIGNLADITLRALSALARANIVYCEDTRHSARLLQHYSIRNETRPFHDHNEGLEITRVLRELEAGKSIALISDAGTPLISDPGYKLVRACADAGFAVFAVPGPSSALAALSSSGLATDQFYFAGFLPPKPHARRSRLESLKSIDATLIVFEAPQRLAESLADMSQMLGPRMAVVARELTKLHEEFARGSLPSLADRFAASDVRGEIVVLIGAPEATAVSDDDIRDRLLAALQSMSLKDAAKVVAELLGVPKSRVYDIGLKIKGAGP